MSNSTYPAWVRGRLVAPGEPAIPADDEGLQLGLSVFDTLLFERGMLLFLERHLERFEGGLAELGISVPWQPAAALEDYLAALAAERGSLPERLLLRLTATRGTPAGGATLLVTARDAEVLPPGGVVLALARTHKAAGDPTEAIKSTNRLRNVLSREEARARGAWEVLFTTTDGFLSEGSISNLFLVLASESGPVLHTPALAQGCLAGITRDLVLEELAREPLVVDGRVVPVVVGELEVACLETALEAFLTNASQRVVPVSRVLGTDGQVLTARLAIPGPVSEGVRARIQAAEERYRSR
ncbi:MAG: aminotransferase class IV [Planctomycetota bacterium]|nr:aminotransferase class IV [Planctomycetota bacterium]